MVIERKKYLDKLISKKDNGLIKVITGIRRCGKSFLLFELYHEYLNSVGVTDDCIIEIALDEAVNARYKNPFELDKYVREVTSDKTKRFYVFIDEVQLVLEMQNPYVYQEEKKVVNSKAKLSKRRACCIGFAGCTFLCALFLLVLIKIESLVELINSTADINDLLLTSEEWVAFRAYFYF